MTGTQRNDGLVVVLGATGTLGTYLVDELVESNYAVFATGRKNVVEDYYSSKGVQSTILDISRQEDFDRLPGMGVRAVIQIAGAMPARMAGYDPQKYIDSNIKGTLNVLNYCRKVNVKKMMYTQSHSDVAGHWNTGKFIPSESPRSIVYKGDHAVYIISKNAAVDLIEHYHQEYGLQTIVFRLPSIFSYRPVEMYVNGEKRVAAYKIMIDKALAGEDLEIWGDPSRAKDVVYVKDFCQIVLKAIESDKGQGVYNVGTGIPTTLEEQIKGIAKVFSPKEMQLKFIYCPEKRSQESYLYDISKTVQDFGYKPKYPYIEMLEDIKREMSGHRFDHLANADITI